MRCFRIALATLAALRPLAAAEARDDLRAPFVDAASFVPGLVVEMRYASSHNFVGRPIPGYEAPRCLLTREAASALLQAQAIFVERGVGLKVFDCYRPKRAVRAFIDWAADPAAQAGKAKFFPNIDKAALLELGYIAARSAHSRGSTVDLTLIDSTTGFELDMGTPFDFFGPASGQAWPDLTPSQAANRRQLRATMIRAGFQPYPQEWWHFTLMREPFPQTGFDVPIRPLAATRRP